MLCLVSVYMSKISLLFSPFHLTDLLYSYLSPSASFPLLVSFCCSHTHLLDWVGCSNMLSLSLSLARRCCLYCAALPPPLFCTALSFVLFSQYISPHFPLSIYFSLYRAVSFYVPPMLACNTCTHILPYISIYTYPLPTYSSTLSPPLLHPRGAPFSSLSRQLRSGQADQCVRLPHVKALPARPHSDSSTCSAISLSLL